MIPGRPSSGGKTGRLRTASFGPYAAAENLSVRFFPNSAATPFTSTESRLAAGFSKRTQQAIGFLNDDK